MKIRKIALSVKITRPDTGKKITHANRRNLDESND